MEEKGENKKEEKSPNQDEVQQRKQTIKRKHKQAFPYGNYKGYYGYRIGQDLEEDPRLKVLKKEWFEGKNCLDIGCNCGIITIHIAKKFHCQTILGIDIDSNRIQDAYWHLRKIVKMENSGKMNGKISRLQVPEDSNGQGNKIAVLSDEEIKNDLFDRVSFLQENFVRSSRKLEECYDTILCLSVTKWIHLNWGDDGLITLFSRIWRSLKPGGILVLEPQPWKSYESNHLVSEAAALNYKNIAFRPHSFQDLLLDKIGFRAVEDLTSSLSGCKAGFNRPILLFQK